MPGRPTVIAAGLMVWVGWLVFSNAHSRAQPWPDRPVKIVLRFTP
jgi:hypothetical protein